MNAVDAIIAKREGQRLSDEQIRFVIDAYTRGALPDEQMSALLMAIYFRGMADDELAVWTTAMLESGDRLDLSGLARPTVDKHSTGGVGDKVSLVLCPLVAACGAAVPQMAGRGLGHTGGTLDKLETIPGWQALVPPEDLRRILDEVGAVMCAAGGDLAPADRKLYALRDVTGTVPSIPLIASSIMSKKIAEGTSALVLDVKVGTGAFMTNLEDARRLAETMVAIGERSGVRTRALITDMSVPLGRAVGNALEVTESVETLRGGGPADLVELTVALAVEMLDLVGITADPAAVLASGAALPVWDQLIRAQHGDPSAELPVAGQVELVRAERAGFLHTLDALAVGKAGWRLGAGRERKEDSVSATAGVVCLAKPGDAVAEGQPILELHVDDPGKLPAALEALAGGITITDAAPDPRPIVIDRVG